MDQNTASSKGRFSFFRVLLIILLFALLFITWSQRRGPHVIMSGKITTLTMKDGVMKYDYAGGRVDIYDNFIVITTQNGSSLFPHESIKAIDFKADR